MYVCIHIYILICKYIYIYVCVCGRHASIYIYMCVTCVYVYIYIHISNAPSLYHLLDLILIVAIYSLGLMGPNRAWCQWPCCPLRQWELKIYFMLFRLSRCESCGFPRIRLKAENCGKYIKLDDGWPESVEEQGLLLLVWRHHITKQYIKDVL